jgi:hypothetical protein
MSWDRRFADPVELPGKNLVTLRDAALSITKLPKACWLLNRTGQPCLRALAHENA